ncbi:hypothetical protein P691DRAFT_831763 [Macrolepiota fuliginosa MF-IS2]|uniref:Uncharacterized protein n=1 Tax=Macrolepiota fuliginosa MF-IS2 TaxID=1400762 RepID=A0A9P5XMZ2_9AGAR|nr:hypothetical protein P691DRAFT_831763 [Macrolepiota fuliginosa MF-IS2]
MANSPSPRNLSYELRDTIFNAALIEGFGVGVYSAVFWFTIYMLFIHRKAKKTPRKLSTFFVIIPLYVLALFQLALRWAIARRAFVVDGDTVENILNSLLTQPTWCIALSVVSFSLMTLIADFVTVWRCWIVWNRNWRVTVVPLLLVFAGMAFCIMAAIFQIDPGTNIATTQSNKFAKFALIYLALSLCSTTISTALIIYRIGFSTTSSNRKILEVIVEPAALYCAILLVYLLLSLRNDHSSGYAQALLIPVTGIAPTMVTARVSLGVARNYATADEGNSRVVSVTISTTSETLHDGNNGRFGRVGPGGRESTGFGDV